MYTVEYDIDLDIFVPVKSNSGHLTYSQAVYQAAQDTIEMNKNRKKLENGGPDNLKDDPDEYYN